MYQVGDLVMYGNTGVCRVEDIGHPQGISEKEQLYYTLAPVYDKEVIYTPVDTKAFMRPVMSRADAERFIDRIPEIPEELNGNRDIRMQSEKYRACLNTHENEDLVRLIKTVYRKNHRSMKVGRHMGSTDQQYVKRAEKLLYGELSVALGIGFEQVRPYIKKRIASVQA